VGAFVLVPFFIMKFTSSCARLAALPLALAAAFPSLAQTDAGTSLPETVVSATRFPEASASLPLSVSVVTAEDIARSGVSTVNEAVMKLLGVPGRLDLSGGNNYVLDLRGFGETANSNQVVIVDGLRLNEADMSVADLAQVSIDSVERIEVLRGTGAVLYGEGATGGVIIVTTKAGAGVKRQNSAQLYAATGSNGLQDLRANAVLASGGFSIDMSATERHSDGHRDNFASVAKGQTVAAQWSNHWLRVGVRAGRNELYSGLPGSLTAAQYVADPRQASSSTDFGDSKKENTGIFAEASLGNWLVAFDANQRSAQYRGVIFGGAYETHLDASNYSLRARHDATLANLKNSFVIGYDEGDWTSLVIKSTYKMIGAVGKSTRSAYYLKDDVTITGSGTRLSAGLRTEEIKRNDGSNPALNTTESAWELGVSQPLAKDVFVYGRVGTSFRLPNVDEFAYTPGGAVLQVQTSKDFELGARWKLLATQFNLRWYQSDLTNEIGFDGVNYQNVNFDPTKRQGVELEVKHAISASLDVRANAAVREAKFVSGTYAGKDVTLVPGQTLAIHADWRPVASHTFGAGLTWVSDQRSDFVNVCKIPAYLTADARYAYQFKNAELALSIANLTDEKYYTAAYGCSTAGVTGSIYPEAGRTLTASLRVKF
jgi:iron complex outermembrane receptor protein